jgi:hypothetical protein
MMQALNMAVAVAVAVEALTQLILLAAAEAVGAVVAEEPVVLARYLLLVLEALEALASQLQGVLAVDGVRLDQTVKL